MSRSRQSYLAAPLDEEISTLAKDRVNPRVSVVGERYSALRWRLDRVDEDLCDGYATEATPGVEAGTPIETKAVKVQHTTQEGRFSVRVSTHESLEEAGGLYSIDVYALVEVPGKDDPAIVVLANELVEPAEVGQYVKRDGGAEQLVRWSLVLEADVDDARWSA